MTYVKNTTVHELNKKEAKITLFMEIKVILEEKW